MKCSVVNSFYSWTLARTLNRAFNKDETRNTHHQLKLHNIFLIWHNSLYDGMSKFLQRDTIVQTNTSPVHTYPIFFDNRELFPRFFLKSTCKYLVKTVIKKTSSFLKPLSRVEIFETRAYRFCRWSPYSHRTAHTLQVFRSYFSRFSVFLCTG